MLKSRRAGKRLSPVITGPFLRERHLLAPLSPVVQSLYTGLCPPILHSVIVLVHDFLKKT